MYSWLLIVMNEFKLIGQLVYLREVIPKLIDP